MTNKDQLREDVIDAAREAYKALDVFFLTGGASDPLRLAYLVLRQKLQALDAPTPVKPENLKLGDRFCFADDERDEQAAVMMEDRGHMGIPLCWRRENGHSVFPFPPGVEVIPIEGE